MVDQTGDKKASAQAEKAYADAAAEAKPVPAPAPEPVPAETVAPASTAKVETTPAVKPAKVEPAEPAAAKPKETRLAGEAVSAKVTKAPAPLAAATAPAKPARKALRKPAPPKAPRIAKSVPAPQPTSLSELKEKIMANTKAATTDYTKLVKDIQGKAETAYAKSSKLASEAVELTKGNVEALVESGKILATGTQALGKEYVAETKSAFDTMTADLKQLAAVKSPTELFQLQGKLARRNFDHAVALSSKSSEQLLKLANEVFAPISNRVSLAVDKFSKAA